jgi:hypothetical protein
MLEKEMALSFVVLQKPIQFLDDASEALFRRLGSVLTVPVSRAHSRRRTQQGYLPLQVALHAFPLGSKLVHRIDPHSRK